MNLKTDSNYKESVTRQIKIHEEQIVGLIGSLNDYVDTFNGTAQNITASSEILSNIINGLTSNRKYGTERVEQFIKKN